MSRNNDVFQVLVTKDNQALAVAGTSVADLSPGQIGVFDFNSNLAVDGSAQVRNFYLAVGLDTDGDGVTDDIAKSAGSHIQNRNIRYYSFKPHSAGQPLQVALTGYTADCETEYGIKLELRNQEIYRTQGYNQFTKTYSIVTSCCDGCDPTCPSGDANEITKQLKENINNDPTGLVIAEATARQALVAATHGTSVDYAAGDVMIDADVDALMVFNAAQADPSTYVYTDLLITTVTQKIHAFCDVNLMYFYPRETFANVTKIAGFKCNGTVETVQELAFEEGSGYDIKQQEYFAKGWTESPYRVSTLNGVADYKTYNAVATEKYDVFALTYDQFSVGAWLEYLNNEATIIAVPEADTVTRDALAGVLDLLLEGHGFDPLADDAAASDVDPEVVEQVIDKTVDTDGISSK